MNDWFVSPRVFYTALALWITGCIFGFGLLAVHAFTPGGVPTSLKPLLAENSGAYQLTMYIHPRCPCTKASLSELQEVMRLGKSQFSRVQFLVEMPLPSSGETWDLTETCRNLVEFGATTEIILDPGGQRAHERGILTSGHVLVLNYAGTQVFSGGITGSRGHVGDNPNRRRLLGVIQHAPAPSPTQSTPVFGCSL